MVLLYNQLLEKVEQEQGIDGLIKIEVSLIIDNKVFVKAVKKVTLDDVSLQV